jgi:rubrerythrin
LNRDRPFPARAAPGSEKRESGPDEFPIGEKLPLGARCFCPAPLARILRSPSEVKLAETLRECAALERRIASFYREFAQAWSKDEELGPFWLALADEEIAHAKLLEDLASRLEPESPQSPIDRAALAELRGYVTGRARILGPITLDEALRATLDLEALELDRLYTALVALAREKPALPADVLEQTRLRLGPHRVPVADVVARRATDEELKRKAERLRRG